MIQVFLEEYEDMKKHENQIFITDERLEIDREIKQVGDDDEEYNFTDL